MNENDVNRYLSIAETDPSRMGWMNGFPPAKDKIVSAKNGSFFEFPALRYSVNHMREFLPTREVRAAKEDYAEFKVKPDKNIDYVIPVPPTICRANQPVFLIAEKIANEYDIKYDDSILKKILRRCIIRKV